MRMRTRWTTTRTRKEARSPGRGMRLLPRRERPAPSREQPASSHEEPVSSRAQPAPLRERPVPPSRDLADEERLRDSGGPEDRSLYSCACGYAWEADVTASVACPHCGAAQAW
jgi:hypothetical protein